MARKYNKYTKEMLENAVRISLSWAEVCRIVGAKPFTGAQTHLKKRAIDFNIDHSHFLGQASARGKISPNKLPLDEHFKNPNSKSSYLRNRMIKEGLKEYKCERCGLNEWCGDKIPLELDHKDSNHWNNNLSNLWIICPNCHAQETLNRRIQNTP